MPSTTAAPSLRTTPADPTDPRTTANAAAAPDEEPAVDIVWIGVVAAGAGVLVVGLIVVIAVATCTRRNDGKSGSDDEDVEEHHISPRPVSKRLSEDPYETHVEMTEVTDNNK